MADWAVWVLAGSFAVTGLCALGVVAARRYYSRRYADEIARIFEVRPLFIAPKGRPVPGAEDIHFETTGGHRLRGCYLRSHPPRRGVILFGLEYGSNRWACYQYCSRLLDAGYDVFAYEPRNQGESDTDPNYAPLQWVTDKDLADAAAAVSYLKKRKDAPAAGQGIGFFGMSKGASVGVLLAAADPYVKCVATDGAYATYTTMVPYMRRFMGIYVQSAKKLRAWVPDWFYGSLGMLVVDQVAVRRNVKFLSVETALRTMRQPLLMIHGKADAYINSTMAEALYGYAGSTHKSLWLVEGAKHNQAITEAGDAYPRRLLEFFNAHLSVTVPDSGQLTPVPTAKSGRLSAARAK